MSIPSCSDRSSASFTASADLCARMSPLERFGPTPAAVTIADGFRALVGRIGLGRAQTGSARK